MEGEEENIRERKYNTDSTSPYTLSGKMQRRISGYSNSLPVSALLATPASHGELPKPYRHSRRWPYVTVNLRLVIDSHSAQSHSRTLRTYSVVFTCTVPLYDSRDRFGDDDILRWEWITSLDYEMEYYRRKRPWRWTMSVRHSRSHRDLSHIQTDLYHLPPQHISWGYQSLCWRCRRKQRAYKLRCLGQNDVCAFTLLYASRSSSHVEPSSSPTWEFVWLLCSLLCEHAQSGIEISGSSCSPAQAFSPNSPCRSEVRLWMCL